MPKIDPVQEAKRRQAMKPQRQKNPTARAAAEARQKAAGQPG